MNIRHQPRALLIFTSFTPSAAATLMHQYVARANGVRHSTKQESLPPPDDRTRVYTVDAAGRPQSLGVEAGRTRLPVESRVARMQTDMVKLAGERAASVLTNRTPRFYFSFRSTGHRRARRS